MLHSRIARVEEEFKQELARILAYDIRDPRVEMATPTRVKISKDLREAIVFISFLEDDPEKEAEALSAIEAAKGYIKHLLAQRIQLKRLPDLHFKLDTSTQEAFDLFKKMDRIREEETPEGKEGTGGPES